MTTRTDPATVMNNSSLNTKAGLVFPGDLQSTYQDFMSISAFKYTRDAAGNAPNLVPGGGNGVGSVFLPMPIGGLSDSYKINYKTDALGVIGGFAKELVGKDFNQIASQLQTSFGNGSLAASGEDLALIGAQELTSTGLQAGGNFISKAFTGKGAPNLGGLANQITAVGSQVLGKSQNPNLSLTFNGVDLKSHQFTWKLVAKNQQESRNIGQIMKFFRTHALPAKSSDFAFTYPDIFKISFHGQQNPNLILFSTQGLFLVAVDFKYDNEGHPAFYAETGDPVSVIMTLSFQERIVLTREDIK